MAPQSDTTTVYVLVCSLAGTILSLAATWDRRRSLLCTADGRLKIFWISLAPFDV
jgi:hypothetical protein